MIEIEEKHNRNEVYFTYSVIEGNTKTLIRKVHIKSIQIKDENNITYFMLYDSNEKVNRDVFRYVNYYLNDKSYHTKELASNALKMLFTYIELFDIDYKNINLEEAKKLKLMLYGDSIHSGNIKINLINRRKIDTVNSYISVYRAFYDYIGIKESPFNKKYSTTGLRDFFYSDYNKNDRYVLSNKTNKSTQKVPMYIRVKDMTKILSVIREKYSIREEIIVRLMYECGLRIGEVLGLTLEDIIESKIDIDDRNYDIGEIIIRNRLTDESYQMAKTCLIPKSKTEYKGKNYNTENIGYQKVYPTLVLISKIDEYIDEIYNKLTKKTQENYINFSKADVVGDGEGLEGDNFYLFINKNGKRLHKSGWNKILREIFLESGLKVDVDSRKHNLNHRFRHGYAMFLKQYRGVSQVDLMYALRHKSITSVEAYFRPTDEDLYIANENAVLSMYEVCPMLKL